jgi:hypothetical protein
MKTPDRKKSRAVAPAEGAKVPRETSEEAEQVKWLIPAERREVLTG